MKKAAIVGATGIVGQQFLTALRKHPWFEVAGLAASERSAGKSYGEALKDPKSGAVRWYVNEAVPEEVLDMPVVDAADLDPSKFDVVFTAVESDQAKEIEPRLAKETPVISTAAAFRYDEDVPLLIPGVNGEHAALLDVQRKQRGWSGFIVPIPNCTTTGLAVSLKPIYDTFGLRSVIMTSMQAVSGAGRSPGVIALDITDNVIPFIPKEEEKVRKETQKILGAMRGKAVEPADFKVSCTCTRVAVLEGHTESVFASTVKKSGVDAVKEAMRKYAGVLSKEGLPSAPRQMIIVQEDPFRPQPRMDRDVDGGMATTVGRIREDDVLENGVKYLLVSHNTKMGAAKGAVLVAELLNKKKYI
ncbi:MAG: aspartate-semialdehyde dehydrogenase [Thaumarchaeota archaeon]|nr:aspartate-semialdehyde dehydrogenase [Nitrososphaerota archaeon]